MTPLKIGAALTATEIAERAQRRGAGSGEGGEHPVVGPGAGHRTIVRRFQSALSGEASRRIAPPAAS